MLDLVPPLCQAIHGVCLPQALGGWHDVDPGHVTAIDGTIGSTEVRNEQKLRLFEE